jgi:hypothetical protein
MTVESFHQDRPSVMENVAVYGAVRLSAEEGGRVIDCYFENPWLEATSRPRWLPRWAFDRLLRFVTRPATAPFVTVPATAFGAIGDGVTDSTEAIQSAFDAAVAMRVGTVQIPPGTSVISQPIETDR